MAKTKVVKTENVEENVHAMDVVEESVESGSEDAKPAESAKPKKRGPKAGGVQKAKNKSKY